MTKEPKFPKGWGLVGGKPLTMTTKTPNPTDTNITEHQTVHVQLHGMAKTLTLLAAAEESYCQAATVLQPAIGEALEYLADLAGWDHEGDLATRLQTGLHLLEEAMGAHNRYMESLK